MEQLQYIIEDSTIAYLLGVNNFTNDESAILELVKNAYDAKALVVSISFLDNRMVIQDDGCGMNADDIINKWMHVGKSDKDYEIVDSNTKPRVLAGSKGVGRFALARLGRKVKLKSHKEGSKVVIWTTDWNSSSLSEEIENEEKGTIITITELREKWSEKKVKGLIDFLSKTYNDTAMKIIVKYPNIPDRVVPAYFPEPILGINCLSKITLSYFSKEKMLKTEIFSDEFSEEARKYCPDFDIDHNYTETDMLSELKASDEIGLSMDELGNYLSELGDFNAQLFFNSKASKIDKERFLYKHSGVLEPLPDGVILYRNAFSITAYEGDKDWLGFGKRSRKSPAGVSHPTGAWRVRATQISGTVQIDKKRNVLLRDMSNRQGLEENAYFTLLVEIILSGIREFERYRQSIVRNINKKNEKKTESKPLRPVSEKIINKPNEIANLSSQEAKQLVDEIKAFQKESDEAKRERENVEERYKYDVRILNVLATLGLKASSIAHEMKNDRNVMSDNVNYIISALKEYGMWKIMEQPEKTTNTYKNVPGLLDSIKKVGKKILSFMDTMLTEVEKKQFDIKCQSVRDVVRDVEGIWLRDNSWISFINEEPKDVNFNFAEDVLRVVLDNLILNSIQQNEAMDHLDVHISFVQEDEMILFSYKDNGCGLDKKYISNPWKILEVHETTRENGHGLGMWIVNNTIVMTGGEIRSISSNEGFGIEFSLGGKM